MEKKILIYLEDYEKTSSDVTGEYETAGVYMFVGYGTTFSKIPLGTVLSFQCMCAKSDVYGFQLTNPSNYETIVESDGSKDSEHREFDGKTEIDFASLVLLSYLLIFCNCIQYPNFHRLLLFCECFLQKFLIFL